MEKELKNSFRESVAKRPPLPETLVAPPQLSEIVMAFLQQDPRVMAAIQGFLASVPRGTYNAELRLTFTRTGDVAASPNGGGN